MVTLGSCGNPTRAGVLLTGLLLKLGTAGFCKFWVQLIFLIIIIGCFCYYWERFCLPLKIFLIVLIYFAVSLYYSIYLILYSYTGGKFLSVFNYKVSYRVLMIANGGLPVWLERSNHEDIGTLYFFLVCGLGCEMRLFPRLFVWSCLSREYRCVTGSNIILLLVVMILALLMWCGTSRNIYAPPLRHSGRPSTRVNFAIVRLHCAGLKSGKVLKLEVRLCEMQNLYLGLVGEEIALTEALNQQATCAELGFCGVVLEQSDVVTDSILLLWRPKFFTPNLETGAFGFGFIYDTSGCNMHRPILTTIAFGTSGVNFLIYMAIFIKIRTMNVHPGNDPVPFVKKRDIKLVGFFFKFALSIGIFFPFLQVLVAKSCCSILKNPHLFEMHRVSFLVFKTRFQAK
uniref:Transmembrane 7 superfamily member 2 n=1 Tax=Angiostrongylus cantonensis TaxID=6313 RepID=A0A158P9D3_ANGCA